MRARLAAVARADPADPVGLLADPVGLLVDRAGLLVDRADFLVDRAGLRGSVRVRTPNHPSRALASHRLMS